MLGNSQVKLTTNVEIDVICVKTGKVIKKINRKNLAVLAGRDLIASFLANEAPAGLTHLAVGTGSTAVASSDASLGSEQHRGSITKYTKSSGSLLVTYYLSSAQANGNSLTEAGLFNASAGGTMFARAVYPVISKTSSIAVMYSWTINIGAS